MQIINSESFRHNLIESSRIAKINCLGEVHDEDWWPDPDEQESYNWSDSIRLEKGGFSRNWEQHKTVDGEVTLRVQIKIHVAADGNMYVAGKAELIEGGVYGTVDDTDVFDLTQISPNNTVTLLDKRLSNTGGDWATIKLEIKNDNG